MFRKYTLTPLRLERDPTAGPVRAFGFFNIDSLILCDPFLTAARERTSGLPGSIRWGSYVVKATNWVVNAK